MPLKPGYVDDALKVPGAFLGVLRNADDQTFLGLYAFTNEGTYIRGYATWITAQGKALHQINGAQIILMDRRFIEAFDALDVHGKVPTEEDIKNGSIKEGPGSWNSQQPNMQPQSGVERPDTVEIPDGDGLSRTALQRAWHLAARIVSSRPWLDVSWVGLDDGPFHLVVHDGANGAALHFDDDQGPTWEPRSAPEQELDWEDVDDVDAVNPTGAVDWVERWGPPAPSTGLTPKAAIYTLIAHLLDIDGLDIDSAEGRWEVRPAPLVHYTDESADAPDSAFSLTEGFSSLAQSVQFYVAQITSVSWGEGAVWHEPLWLVTRDGEPRLVLDEAGQVHMRHDSLSDVLMARSAPVSLGGIEDPFSFDLLDALLRVEGGLDRLAGLLRDGPGQTLRAVKPNNLTPPPAGGASDTTSSGMAKDTVPPEDGFPTTCRDVRHFNTELVRWLGRTAPGATLGQSHDEVVTTVPIGEELCLLRGETTREGVAGYLERKLSHDAPFFVAPSTKKVVHRVTVGREGRIRGFYLYTQYDYAEPRPLASADGSPFGSHEVWFKILDAVAMLHTRGHQRLRVIPALGDLSPHLSVVLAEGINGSRSGWRDDSEVLSYSVGQQFQVGNLLVGPDTPLSAVADEILAGASDKGIGIDWAYAGWYSELLAEAHRLGCIPVAHSGFGTWALGYYHGQAPVPFPPPPVYRTQVGFTDVFLEPDSVQSEATSPAREGFAVDVTKLSDTALVASFTDNHEHFVGLFALTPDADYRRDQGAWIRYEKDDEIYLDVLVPVSYRFIKAFDSLQAHGNPPDWSLANRMRVFSGLSVGPSGKQSEIESTDVGVDGPGLITAKEIVDSYGVALKTVQRWLSAGKLQPTMKLPGKTGAHLFTRAEADRAFGKHHKREEASDTSGAATSTTTTTTPGNPNGLDGPLILKEPTPFESSVERKGDRITVTLFQSPHTLKRAQEGASAMLQPGENLEYIPGAKPSSTHYVFAIHKPQPEDGGVPFTYPYA